MRRALALGCFVGLFSLIAAAQSNPSFEIFGGYSFLRESKVVASPIPFGVSSDFVFPQQIPSKSVNMNGWEASFAYRWNHIGLVLDTSGHYGSTNTEIECNFRFGCPPIPVKMRLTLQNYILAGPRYYFGGDRFDPFLHALFGYTHFNARFPANTVFAPAFIQKGQGLGIALGGGVDVKIAPHFGYRLLQADYFLTHLNRNTQNNLRASTGLLLKF